jgi:hypothetical protein
MSSDVKLASAGEVFLEITSGRGRTEDGKTFPSGDIRFLIDGVERLRICADGRFLVLGVPVINDTEVYMTFKSWLQGVTTRQSPTGIFLESGNKPLP